MNLQLGKIYPQQREGHGAVRARPSRTGPVKGSREGGEGPPGVGRCARDEGRGDCGLGRNVATKMGLTGPSWILCVLDFCYLKNDLHPQASMDIS